MNASEKLYRNIEAERARAGWTIRQTAEKLNIEEKTYRNRRDNLSKLSGDDLVDIAQLFNVSVDYLLGLTDKIRPD